MSTLADIIGQYGTEYQKKYGDRLLPSHRKVMRRIASCRTPEMGGQKWLCPACGKIRYSYHSCRDRHCPKCQNDRIDQWLGKQFKLLFQVPYFMATVTVPKALRAIFRSHQKTLYHLFFKASAEAILLLAKDKRFLGAELGMMGILQTWTRQLIYHPHIHFLIPGGGIRKGQWKYAKPDFLMHVKPLSRLIRRKFMELLKENDLFEKVPADVWSQQWVCHIEPVGNGEAVLRYLAPYVYRVAISDRNILTVKDRKVTFRYKDRTDNSYHRCTLDAFEFLRRFLQHILPKGFVKIRYFGFLATRKRQALEYIKEQIGKRLAVKVPLYPKKHKQPPRCPHCGQILVFVCEFPAYRRPP